MFDHKNCLRGLALAFALSQGLDAQAFRVANFVNHQMVLQREAPVSLCGTVDPGEKVTVSFAGATVAAAVTPEKPLGGFAVAGKDGVWQWAEAVIDGETVVVSSPKVSAPCSVRYAYDGDPSERANLYGKAALLPAVPFSETLR